MQTFTEPKDLVDNPHYEDKRRKTLAGLSDDMLDAPIIEIVKGFNRLPHCFTLQSCYGHFLYNHQKDPHNVEPLPLTDSIASVEYRIAYIALCVESSASGRRLLMALEGITSIDPDNVQFCCAEWFWKRQVNSYALQVEPDRYKHQDKAMLDYVEALSVEKVRNEFFLKLQELLQEQRTIDASS